MMIQGGDGLLIDGIILTCSTSIKTNRTYAAIYNILKGTKGIQTVLDIHLYHLENMYGIYPSLQKTEFDAHIKRLIHAKAIVSVDENNVKATLKGEELLEQYEQEPIYHYFKGLQFIGITEIFMERLLLTIQTFTNKHVRYNQFIPVIDKTEIHIWVKRYYHKHKMDITSVLSGLYEELFRLLSQLTDREASLFVDRLTGHNHYGKSTYQLRMKYNISISDVCLILVAITQRFLSTIIHNQDDYPILNEFIVDLHRVNSMTKSATKTYHLYQKGLQADEIASIRKLKINTIYDHLVEIALYDPAFYYQSYVDQTEVNVILKAIQQSKTFKLKDIKSLINRDITYFQIRLVMAMMGKND